jgi:hypothetical protein
MALYRVGTMGSFPKVYQANLSVTDFAAIPLERRGRSEDGIS